MGSGKHRWKLSFHHHKSPPQPPPSSSLKKQQQTQNPTNNHQQHEPAATQEPPPIPMEFLCPVSGTLMADPVIVPSGHTFERNSLLACISLSYNPPNQHLSTTTIMIPNLALKATILNWCRAQLTHPPKPLDYTSAQNIVRNRLMSDVTRTPSSLSNISSSDESVAPRVDLPTPLPLTTRPSCYSSSSSCDIDITTSSPNLLEEENNLVNKLKSPQIHDQEDALTTLRKLTRTQEETRVRLCTPRILSALKPLISSRYSTLQVNSVAALVNLSLEKQNKVKIVRSGIVPLLIDVLRGGFPESQDHAAGAIFSLSLDNQNKTAIGVLGALPPLLHALRSESERTRHDSALALYHLSLVQSNRVKMIKLGAVQILLGMVRSGHMPGRVMLVLCNLAASVEGRAAMLDGGAVECFVGLLGRGEFDSVATRESCLTAFYGLSYGGLRFKGLAKEAGAEEVLRKLEEETGGSAKAGKILEVLRERHEEEEEVNWEELLNSEGEDDLSRTRCRPGSNSC